MTKQDTSSKGKEKPEKRRENTSSRDVDASMAARFRIAPPLKSGRMSGDFLPKLYSVWISSPARAGELKREDRPLSVGELRLRFFERAVHP